MDELLEPLTAMVRLALGEYGLPVPEINILPRRPRGGVGIGTAQNSRRSSSGATFFRPGCGPLITLHVGSDHLDLILVTLHEAAHCVVPPVYDSLGRLRSHTRAFYRVAGHLYHEWRVPLGYAQWREGQYVKGSGRSLSEAYRL